MGIFSALKPLLPIVTISPVPVSYAASGDDIEWLKKSKNGSDAKKLLSFCIQCDIT